MGSTSLTKTDPHEFVKTPLPEDLAKRDIGLTENARTVLKKRYLRRGPDGKPVETVEEMFWRVAYNVALAEKTLGGDEAQVEQWARKFYDLLTGLQFFPNSPTFTGAGTPLGQLAACFVLRIDDDMGRTGSGIFETLRHAALIQQTGGGNGFSFSRLRPKGSIVKTSNGIATGPIGFLRVYDQAFGEIAQGGSRRGANMAVLNISHPDIRDFITSKSKEGNIANFNISVGITDEFMSAVETGSTFDLVNPVDGKVWETVDARELFKMIVEYAHHNGEPGVLFLDAANRENPVPHLYELESTNPCFVGSARIATEFGLLRLDELAESEIAAFVASDNRAPTNHKSKDIGTIPGVALRPASPVWMTRSNAPVMKLTTKGGYQITATPDHKFLTTKGYVELQNLNIGDRLLIQSGEGAWSRNYDLPNVQYMQEIMAEMALSGDRASGHTVQRRDFHNLYANLPQKWSYELGIVIGWLVGDGWLSPNSGSPLGMVFSKDESLELIHSAMQNWFGSGHIHDRTSLKQMTYGRVPFEFFHSLGVLAVPAHEKRVPDSIWTAPREVVIGFLQALFSADGTVHTKGLNHDCTVRLASSSPDLLRDVQILLGNFGIAARIYQRRKAGVQAMPDGKGGLKDYNYKAQYELIIGRANRDRFAEVIGFIDEAKQAKVELYISTKRRPPVSEPFVESVASIEDAGTADVYDLTQFQTHDLIVNNIVVSNCGEQFLGPFENCCLGSVNLSQHITKDDEVDWEKLAESVATSTRFLDDVVTANAYVPAIPQLREAAENVRRIGLGIMGLGDMMYHLGIRYGSIEGQEFASQVMEFVRYHAMQTSIELAKERGPFLAIEGSRYDPNNLKWTAPKPIVEHKSDWGRPVVDWKKIEKGLKKYGIRNGAQLTVAPTGTIATVAGCEAYGCEPVFALAYLRYVNENAGNTDAKITLQYTSPLFENALRKAGLDQATIDKIVAQVNETGSCQNVPDVPENIRRVFVTAGDITAEEHIRMQAALQAHTDNAISKTINFPAGTTEEEVATAYLLGWKLGCKGLTVYVTGSREVVVLETAETKKKKEGGQTEAPIAAPAAPQPLPLFNEDKKPRPSNLEGKTYRMPTPAGTSYITINENGEGHGQPFEVFIHTSKAGSEIAAVSEAIGRLVSLVLRLASPVSPRSRVKQIVRQLGGIGGGRQLGIGPNKVISLPDAVSQVLQQYLDDTSEADNLPQIPRKATQQMALLPAENGNGTAEEKSYMEYMPIGDICPECGTSTLMREEGCLHCYTCGYSEC